MTIHIKNLNKSFGNTIALNTINLSIEDGEFIAILGPSGCGKTTLLKLLAGFDSPSAGQIYINGQCVSDNRHALPPEKRNIGMVFQSFALWPHLNVTEHIRFPLIHHKNVSKELKNNLNNRINEVLEIVNLQAFSRRMPHELSGGQKQRVALARAIASKPALLLMDEPLSSLDAELRMEMRKEIQALHRMTGTTIIYVTHDQEEALAMADKIVVMKDGQIQQYDTPQQIFYHPETEFVAQFVGKSNLIKGIWHDEHTFEPNSTTSTIPILWRNLKVSENLKSKNVCPIRPEQLSISCNGEGIQGKIINVQFQGKEMHYTLDVEDNIITIHENARRKPFKIDDNVVINLELADLSKEIAETML